MLLSAGGWCVSVFCSRFSKYQTISWSNSALSLLNVNTENIKWQLLQEKKMKKIHVFYIPCKNSGSRIAACITSLLSALWSVDNMLLRCCSSSYCCVLIVCYYEIDPGQARPLSVLKAPLRCNDQPVMDESQLDRDRCGGHTHTHTHTHMHTLMHHFFSNCHTVQCVRGLSVSVCLRRCGFAKVCLFQWAVCQSGDAQRLQSLFYLLGSVRKMEACPCAFHKDSIKGSRTMRPMQCVCKHTESVWA